MNRGVLPEWARTGFSDPRPRMPHTLGRSHRIVAILFGHPLRCSPGCWRLSLTWSGRSDVLDLRYN